MSDGPKTWPEAFVVCFLTLILFVAYCGLPFGLLIWMMLTISKGTP